MSMPNKVRTIITGFVLFMAFSPEVLCEDAPLFPDLGSRKEFASEISGLVEEGWQRWQDAVVINGVEVDGSIGLLSPGDIREPVLTADLILASFDRSGRSQEYIDCVRAVAFAIEEGMRKWQRGYSHKNIPFPQGASCVFTMPPSNNVPVTVSTGESSGEGAMAERELYNFMLYRAPRDEDGIIIVLKASAKALSRSFELWQERCSIVGLLASGGIAPQPAPMGSGPGPVRGAKANGGKFLGQYLKGSYMETVMTEYFVAIEPRRSSR